MNLKKAGNAEQQSPQGRAGVEAGKQAGVWAHSGDSLMDVKRVPPLGAGCAKPVVGCKLTPQKI